MQYMIRETYTVKRGRVPEHVEDLKIIVEFMKAQGISDHRLCVDFTKTMDTVYHEFVVDSLDQFFGFERGVYVNPDEETVAGKREIYEIVA